MESKASSEDSIDSSTNSDSLLADNNNSSKINSAESQENSDINLDNYLNEDKKSEELTA